MEVAELVADTSDAGRGKTWLFKNNRIVLYSSAEGNGEDHEKETEEDTEGKRPF